MKCTKARELLSDRHNGELEPRASEGLTRHLKGCAACRGAAGELDEMLALMGAAPSPGLPPGFADGLHDRLVAEGRDAPADLAPEPAALRSPWGSAVRGLGLAAAGAAAAVLVLWVASPSQPALSVRCPGPGHAATGAVKAPGTALASRSADRRMRVGQVAVLVLSIRAQGHHADARLQVVLPDGVSLLGDGARALEEKQMEWTATLSPGENEIRIPVRAQRAGTWLFVARARAAGFRSASEARLVVTRS